MTVTVMERYYAEGVWRANSAIHIGGDLPPATTGPQMQILRDGQGRPYVPGTSIMGAVRSVLRTSEGEGDALRCLLGGDVDQPNRKVQYGSVLYSLDAAADELPSEVVVRDGVQIEDSTRVAADKFKYDFEVLPAGTSFRFRFKLDVYNKPALGVSIDDLLATFGAVLRSLSEGQVWLGAKTRRGLGRGRVNDWIIRRFSSGNLAHWRSWLAHDFANGGDPVSLESLPKVSLPDQRRFVLQGNFEIKTSLLIRSALHRATGPDTTHLQENRRPLLTGSSLTGPLRLHCLRIARALEIPDAQEMISSMFGPKRKSVSDTTKLRASRVCVSESEISNVEHRVHTRTAIDRFTSAPIDGALFSEAPVFPATATSNSHPKQHLTVRIELKDPEKREAGLLLAAFKDLWGGLLPLGGQTAIGRGVLKGLEGSAEYPDLEPIRIGSEYRVSAGPKEQYSELMRELRASA